MAKIIVTLRVMPSSPEEDLDALQEQVEKAVKAFCGREDLRTSREPIAFGLKAIDVKFVHDEDNGALDPLEEELADLEAVASAQVKDVRRALG